MSDEIKPAETTPVVPVSAPVATPAPEVSEVQPTETAAPTATA